MLRVYVNIYFNNWYDLLPVVARVPPFYPRRRYGGLPLSYDLWEEISLPIDIQFDMGSAAGIPTAPLLTPNS